jgi:sodium-coupled neutral amino acid transporter 11
MRVNNAVELQEETEEEQSGKFNSLPLASFNFINSIIGSGVIGKG